MIYGVRPERLELAADGFAARIAVIEPTGSETHVILHLEGREMVAVFRDRHAFRVGETLRLAPTRRARAHLRQGERGAARVRHGAGGRDDAEGDRLRG